MFIGFMLLQLAAHFLGSGGSHFCDWIGWGRRLNSKQLMPYSIREVVFMYGDWR
jgi:hypothetical protein